LRKEWALVGNDRRFFVARTPRIAIKTLKIVRFVAALLQCNSFHGRLALRKDDTLRVVVNHPGAESAGSLNEGG
jgi:hypothetical protein